MGTSQSRLRLLPDETRILRFTVRYPVMDETLDDGEYTAYDTMDVEIPQTQYQQQGSDGVIERVLHRAFQPECAAVAPSEWQTAFTCTLSEELALEDFIERHPHSQ